MTEEKKVPNKNGEFLIDVTPVFEEENGAFIYDCTAFFDFFKGIPRERMIECVNHTVKGKQYTVYIIDRHNMLTKKTAKQLAKEWYLGNAIASGLDKLY